MELYNRVIANRESYRLLFAGASWHIFETGEFLANNSSDLIKVVNRLKIKFSNDECFKYREYFWYNKTRN